MGPVFFFFFFVSDPPSPSHPTLTYVHRTLCRAAVGWFTVGQRVPPGKCAWISDCCITALFTVSHVISHPGCLGLLSAARLPANLSSIITQCFHHTVLKSFFFSYPSSMWNIVRISFSRFDEMCDCFPSRNTCIPFAVKQDTNLKLFF